MTIEFKATEHDMVHDALTELNFSRDRAIGLGSRFFTVTQATFEMIEAKGIQPTTYHDVRGQIISVPGRN